MCSLPLQVVLLNLLVFLPRMANEILLLNNICYMFKLVLQSGILSLDPIHDMVKLMLHWESKVENLLSCLYLHFNFVFHMNLSFHI